MWKTNPAARKVNNMDAKKWNRCDECGVFISFDDLEKGLAIREMETPDTDYTSETWITLCKKHNEEAFTKAVKGEK